MVPLILKAAQGASSGLYLDTARLTERSELSEGAHPFGTDDFLAFAAFAAFFRALAQLNAAALLRLKNSICHLIIRNLIW